MRVTRGSVGPPGPGARFPRAPTLLQWMLRPHPRPPAHASSRARPQKNRYKDMNIKGIRKHGLTKGQLMMDRHSRMAKGSGTAKKGGGGGKFTWGSAFINRVRRRSFVSFSSQLGVQTYCSPPLSCTSHPAREPIL